MRYICRVPETENRSDVRVCSIAMAIPATVPASDVPPAVRFLCDTCPDGMREPVHIVNCNCQCMLNSGVGEARKSPCHPVLHDVNVHLHRNLLRAMHNSVNIARTPGNASLSGTRDGRTPWCTFRFRLPSVRGRTIARCKRRWRRPRGRARAGRSEQLARPKHVGRGRDQRPLARSFSYASLACGGSACSADEHCPSSQPRQCPRCPPPTARRVPVSARTPPVSRPLPVTHLHVRTPTSTPHTRLYISRLSPSSCCSTHLPSTHLHDCVSSPKAQGLDPLARRCTRCLPPGEQLHDARRAPIRSPHLPVLSSRAHGSRG